MQCAQNGTFELPSSRVTQHQHPSSAGTECGRGKADMAGFREVRVVGRRQSRVIVSRRKVE